MILAADVGETDVRLQMFSYYNTLAWAILAATIAAVVALGTLPFFLSNLGDFRLMIFACDETFAALVFAGGLWLTYHIRAYAVKWVCFPGENYATSLQRRIDYIETGVWQANPSIRAKATNTFTIAFALLGAGYLTVSAVIWILVMK